MKANILILFLIVSSSGLLTLPSEGKMAKQAEKGESILPLCSNHDLFNISFTQGHTVEHDCIYTIDTVPLKVLQVIDGGVLLVPVTAEVNPFDKVIFVKTKGQYVDGDVIEDFSVKYTGIKSYATAMGANKTVHSFQQVSGSKPAPETTQSKEPIRKSMKSSSCQDTCFKNADEHAFKEGETLERCLQTSCGH